MFEYDTVDFASHNVGAFLRHLNKLASEGWQVICAINGGTLLIGRRLTPDAPDGSKALPIVANPSEVTSPFTDDNQ